MNNSSLDDQNSETIFKWPNGPTYTFSGDDRLDPDLFALAAKSWEFLNDALTDIRLDRRSTEWSSRVLAVYYASRMYGASAGATMMIAHGLGREAIILSRCQYEYFIKLLYYDHNHEEATNILELLDSYSLRFAESVNLDVRQGLSEEAVAKLERLSKAAYRGNLVAIVNRLENDPRLKESAEEGNPSRKDF